MPNHAERIVAEDRDLDRHVLLPQDSKLRQPCLRAAGMVAQGVDQVDLRRTDALLPQGQQHQLFRFPGDFGDLPVCFVHKDTSDR